MKKATVLKLAASSLVLGATAIGCKPAGDAHPMTLSARAPRAADGAAAAARRAERALAAKRADQAVASAEQAVALQPQDGGYRQLLGRAYLAAGRFAAAETAFTDTLALDPAAGRAQLSLALAQIANGQAAAARVTLAAAGDGVAEADRGLALALAGDHDGAVRLLEVAARAPGAGAKVRQNLALAYAFSGDWAKAQATAAQDLSLLSLADRMVQWARFVRAPDPRWQVASLIGTTPVQDPGQPVQLALVRPNAAASELAAAVPMAVPAAAAPTVTVADAAPVEVRPAALPATPPLLRVSRGPVKVAAASPRVPALLAAPRHAAAGQGGGWVVQLGAFSERTPIEAAWSNVTRRDRTLGGYAPSQARVAAQRATLTRLSIAGFASRDTAMRVCGRIRAVGGDCFVRAAAGEAPVRMAARIAGTQLASR